MGTLEIPTYSRAMLHPLLYAHAQAGHLAHITQSRRQALVCEQRSPLCVPYSRAIAQQHRLVMLGESSFPHKLFILNQTAQSI